jgi:hypothetical protein
MSIKLWSIFRTLLVVGILALGAAGAAKAQAYSFNGFLGGGGGGQDPEKKRVATSMGAYICLSVSQGATPNTVGFLVSSRIPQPNSRVTNVSFDLGRHAGLFSSLAVTFASPGVKGQVTPAQQHPFLRGLTPEFAVHSPQQGHLKPEGLSPGRMIAIAATLGPGKSIVDVFNALNEGLNPATAANGLRVGVIVLYLLGGPPPGVATIQDDGGFVMTAPSPACQ